MLYSHREVPERLELEMGLSHSDFFRLLPRLQMESEVDLEQRVRIVLPRGEVTITLGPEQERRIASIRLPRMQVRFDFFSTDAGGRRAFLDAFARCYQRGGG